MDNSSTNNPDCSSYITFDEQSYKMLYKGVDIGISREFIQDLRANFGFDVNELSNLLEYLYSKNISVVRDNKIDLIFND